MEWHRVYGISNCSMGSFNSDIITLTINALLWVIVSCYLIKHYSYKNTGVIVVLFYTIISVFAIDFFIREPEGWIFPWNKIEILPLLILLVFVLLFSGLIINSYKIRRFKQPPLKLINTIGIIVSILSLVDIVSIINNFSTGLVLLMTDDNYGNELYLQSTNDLVYNIQRSGVINIIGSLSTLTKNFAPMIFLIYLTYTKRNKILVISLALSTFVVYMYGVSMGLRSMIIQNLLTFILFYLYIKRFYSKKTRYWFNLLMGCFFGCILLGTVLITVSRANTVKGFSPVTFAESYATQGILFLGGYGIDNGDEIRYGDRTFPFIKSFFTDDVARDVVDRRLKYPKMKINDVVFYTFVGDFIFDFGVIGGIFILCLLYLLYRSLLKGNTKSIDLSQIMIIYLLCFMLVGFYLYPLDGYAGNIFLISIILFSIVYKIIYNDNTI